MTRIHAERPEARSTLEAEATEGLFEAVSGAAPGEETSETARPAFLAEILGTLRWLDRCPAGILHVRTLGDRARLYLSDGQIRCATGAGAVGIGERMRAKGLISDDALSEALRMQRRFDPPAPLGLCLALVSQSAADALPLFLREQVVEVIRNCSAWPVGVIEYEAAPVRHRGIEVAFRIEEIAGDVG